MTEAEFCRYDDLPLLAPLGIRTSWGKLDGSLGTLGLLADTAVREAAQSVVSGLVLSLSLDSDLLNPPLFGRRPTVHTLSETGRNIFEDELDQFNPQSSSQLDGLLHVRAREYGFYGGITDHDEARDTLGMHHWAQRAIVGRGVLVDVRGHYGQEWNPFEERTLGVEELTSILAAQNVTLEPGDILCLRFGWVAEYRARQNRRENLTSAGDEFAGIASTDDMVRFLWNSQIAAVMADNPAVESAPGNPKNGSLHRKLIPGLGYALGELLDLDKLAEACQARGRFDFLFVAAPLNLYGAASSTANALAIL